MKQIPLISSLPRSMVERALWARQAFIEDPEGSQIDDEVLVWMYNDQDKLWYSIAGNYSSMSPEQKRLKDFEREEKNIQNETDALQIANVYYKEVLYQSEIRKKVFERDFDTCQLCLKSGKSNLHVHHILKRREGGGDTLDNLITVCPSCHRKADSKLYYNPKWKY